MRAATLRANIASASSPPTRASMPGRALRVSDDDPDRRPARPVQDNVHLDGWGVVWGDGVPDGGARRRMRRAEVVCGSTDADHPKPEEDTPAQPQPAEPQPAEPTDSPAADSGSGGGGALSGRARPGAGRGAGPTGDDT